jgi:hypothetical protein
VNTSNHVQDHHDTGTALMTAAKASLPVAVSTLSLFGVPVENWVIVATLIYTALLIVHQVITICKEFKTR